MKGIKGVTTFSAGIVALAFAAGIGAAPVVCGNAGLGMRTVTIDPGLVGGFCYGQNGNLQDADIAALAAGPLPGLVSLDKDETSDFPTGDPSEGALQFTLLGSANGTWSFGSLLWNIWDRLFLGFHFGGGGNTPSDNPDSFVVELAAFDFAGTFALGGGQINGLSNIQLLGIRCQQPGCNNQQVPEPNSALLLALGMLALAGGLRLAKR
jgi:hypothetical protein